MVYLNLFWSFFQIGLFSFGGGFAAMPLIQNQVVDIHGWLTPAEFADLITISEMTPGPIAINSATFVGTQIAGFGGALVSTLGCILPSCIIVSLLAWVYKKYREIVVIKGVLAGLRPTVVALILAAGLSLLVMSFWGQDNFIWDIASIDFIAVILFVSGLFVLRKFKLTPIFVMLGSGIIGGACYLLI
ncbi:chromate transporter [Christensenellaceae bacterium OttesenSCG-928-K19]|nr:chromate transporter [Christensenellaceae bacterium OttesenSCG-928-K19]